MPRNRSRGVCALVVLGLVCAPALSGCAGGETQPATAESHGGGLIGGFVEQLKREDDENELKELAEHEFTKEEREEAHERLEQEEVEASNAREPGEEGWSHEAS
jgi:hypothetical protein